MTPTPSPSALELASWPHAIAEWLGSFVEANHKRFAALWGLLATTGVVGVPAGAKLGGGALLLYAAACHVGEKLFTR